MAVHDNPRIITNGLIAYYDAANPKGYDSVGYYGGGSLYDLSGNGNHLELYNGVTYSNGILIFDGVDSWGNTDIMTLSQYDSITCEIVFKPDSGNNGILYELADSFVGANNFGFSVNTGETGFFEANTAYNSHANDPRIYASNLNTNTWGFHSHTYTRVVDSNGRYAFQDGQAKTFLSGDEISNTTATIAGSTFGGISNLYTQLNIGARVEFDFGPISFPYKGSFSSFKMYGRKLTLAEHRINFNAFRRRFGL